LITPRIIFNFIRPLTTLKVIAKELFYSYLELVNIELGLNLALFEEGIPANTHFRFVSSHLFVQVLTM